MNADVEHRSPSSQALLVTVSPGFLDAPVVQLHGELDFSNRADLDRAIDRALGTARGVIFLDLRLLRFIDSSGLHVIVRADRKATSGGNRLIIVRGSSQIQQIFALTRTEERLSFVDSLPDE